MKDEVLVELARAETPLGEWVLRRRDDVFELIGNGAFLMDSGDATTERALADLTLNPGSELVLVGGLGLGFTLRAVLARDVQRVVVAEIAAQLIEWSRGPLEPLLAEPLGDARVELRVADVIDVARSLRECDAIVLDVDNGPDLLVHSDNAHIYGPKGLAALHDALRPGGRLGIWSSTHSARLSAALGRRFEHVEVHELSLTRFGRDVTYFVYVATA